MILELVKRDGHHEECELSKFARSLVRAGVAPYMLTGILDAIDMMPGMDTGLLRSRVERELARRQPRAARRYAATRTLTVSVAKSSGRGWVSMHPETIGRVGAKPGDLVRLAYGGAAASLPVTGNEGVAPGWVWLDPAELAVMGITEGTKLAASLDVKQEVLLASRRSFYLPLNRFEPEALPTADTTAAGAQTTRPWGAGVGSGSCR